MRKVKLSLSLVLTFVLVALASFTVSAAALTQVKNVYPTYDSGTGKVTIAFTKVQNATSYDVTLEEVGGVTLPTQNVTGNSVNFTPVDFNDFDLKVTIVAKNGTPGEESTKIVTYTKLPDTLTGTNVNLTGTDLNGATNGGTTRAHSIIGDTSKSQQVHGAYQNNTSSCASCHQTHTGSDSNFLFKKGNICETCHDGTLGVYDVTDVAMAGNAGYFAGQNSAAGTSMHNVDGSVQIMAAPGGFNSYSGTGNANWGGDFGCESCHNPHGSASGKLLTVDPMGWSTVNHGAYGTDAYNGQKFDNINIVDVTSTASATSFWTVATTPGTALATLPVEKVSALADKILVRTTVKYANSPFKDAKFAAITGTLKPVEGDTILMTYRWDDVALKYVPDYSFWKRAYSSGNIAAMFFNDAAGTTATDVSAQKTSFVDGFMFATDGTVINAVQRANMSFGVAVDFLVKVSYDQGYRQEDTVNGAFFNSNLRFGDSLVAAKDAYLPDSGYSMSRFCAACHADYYSQGHSKVTSTSGYSSAFRHTTKDDGYSCVRCHFAHGTSKEIMLDAKDQKYTDLVGAGKKFDPANYGGVLADAEAAALAYMKDETPDSALKRYTGMSVCFSCHDSAIMASGSDKITTDNWELRRPGTGATAGTGLDAVGNKAEYEILDGYHSY